MREIPENNLAYPVFIQLDTNKCGSGFFLSHGDSLYLVTAKHVIFEENNLFKGSKSFQVSWYSDNQSLKDAMVISIDYKEVESEVKVHPTFDVVLVKIGQHKVGTQGKFLKGVTIVNQPVGLTMVWIADTMFKKYEDIFISNDVFIFGYPISIGNRKRDQVDPSRPLLRKGIVAGKNEKKRTIILDSPVYFGNSGGLVIEVHTDKDSGEKKFLPIGIVSEYIPFIEELFNSQHNEVTAINIQNSGYSVAIPIDTILDILV